MVVLQCSGATFTALGSPALNDFMTTLSSWKFIILSFNVGGFRSALLVKLFQFFQTHHGLRYKNIQSFNVSLLYILSSSSRLNVVSDKAFIAERTSRSHLELACNPHKCLMLLLIAY